MRWWAQNTVRRSHDEAGRRRRVMPLIFGCLLLRVVATSRTHDEGRYDQAFATGGR